MVAIEAGGDLLIERRVGDHVAGDLLEREAVERLRREGCSAEE